MAEQWKPVGVIDAPCGRSISNALRTRLVVAGEAEAYATAQQGAGDGYGSKLGILLGLKNGSEGTSVLTYADGRALRIPTKREGPTEVTTTTGEPVLSVLRSEKVRPGSIVTAPDGSTIFTVVPDPDEPKDDARYRLQLLDGTGAPLAQADVMRVGGGGKWSAEDYVDFVDSAMNLFISDGGGNLPMPFLGVRTLLHRELTDLERDAHAVMCTEINVAVRPYVTEMGIHGAAWS